MTNFAANSKGAAKRKPKGKPRGKPFKANNPMTGEVDTRINRIGTPPRGASAKEIYDFYDELTPAQIIEMLPPGKLKKIYQTMPAHILMKHVRTLRIYAEIWLTASPALVNSVTDRTDGKVTTPIQVENTPILVFKKAGDDAGHDPNTDA